MQKFRLVLSCLVVALPVFFLYQSCGITKPRYIEYDEAEAGQTTSEGIANGEGPAGDNTTVDPAAVFLAKVQPAVTKSCGTSGCHGGGAGGLTLTNDNAEANRTALKDFSADAQAIFDKISAASHGGGDQSSNLPLADLQAWIAAENGGTGGDEGSEGTDAPEKECPPESIFLTQIQPAIVKSCGTGSCHGGGAGALTLDPANDKAPTNRPALYDFDTTAEAIFNKISNAAHGGGDRSADLPKANIEAWIAAEDACK